MSLVVLGLQPFRPPVQYNQLGSLPQRSLNLSLSHGLEEKGASFHGYGAELHYHNQFLKPAQLQVNNEPKNLNRVFLLSLSCIYLFSLLVCLFKPFAFSQLSINGVAEFRELLMVMCCHFWQVCSFRETTKRVLNRQQNRLWTYQGSGIGSMGGFERVSGGTGVFHPRVLNTTTTTSNPQVKKKQGELLFLCSAVRSFDFVFYFIFVNFILVLFVLS